MCTDRLSTRMEEGHLYGVLGPKRSVQYVGFKVGTALIVSIFEY